MTVIGFVTYEDFRSEIQGAQIPVVRLQDYYRIHRSDGGMRWFQFFVELAAAHGEEIYVARFPMGEILDMPGKEEEIERVKGRASKLMGFLRRDLEDLGVKVRPGLVAAAAEAKIVTTLPSLERDYETEGER